MLLLKKVNMVFPIFSTKFYGDKMKKFLLFLSTLLLPISFALIINVEIKDVCQVEVKSLNIDEKPIPKISAEIYNSGSLPYYFRVQIDGEARVWSAKTFSQPGEIKKVNLYFLPSNKTKLKIHFCNKILEREINISSFFANKTEDFESLIARAYDNFLIVEIFSKKEDKILLLPYSYPENWIIEENIENVKKGKNLMKINFESESFRERNITFFVYSFNSNSYSILNFKVEKKIGLEYWLFFLYDNFRLFLQSKT